MNQQIGAQAVGNAVWQTTLASTVSKISGVVGSLIIFRSLDPATYGVWRIALALSGLLFGWLMALGAVITVEAIRSLRNSETKEGLSMWRGLVRTTLMLALALDVVGFFFAGRIASYLKVSDSNLIIIAFSLVFLWLVKSHAFTWFSISYQFAKQSRLTILESVIYPASLLIFLVFQKDGALGLGLANAVTALALALLSLPALFFGLRQCPKISWTGEALLLLRLLRQHGKWAVAGDVLKKNFDAARIWLINFFLDPAAVGLFGMAESLLGHVTTLVNLAPALFAALPRYVHDKQQFTAAAARAVRFGSAISLFSFAVSWLLVPTLLPFLFPKFTPAIPLFLILTGILLTTGMTSMLNAAYPALRWQKRLFFFSLIRLSLSFILLLVFVPYIGLWAVPIEAVATGYGFMIVRWASLKKGLAMPVKVSALVPGQKEIREIFLFLKGKIQL